ncbi:MAG: UDP-N-acetylmuramate--L-alanine ligase [Lachnospiraceae bacterium]|nr:UDP-N-acetylmuramate--L-alanine ligase [Lachnospiraceae bacterium]
MYQINFSDPINVHFVGIGGISMSGLAEILVDRGFTVTGSDNTPSDITDHLSSLGIKIAFPQKAENISDDTQLVVYTAAIHPDNPEYRRAEEMGLPMLKRAELLGQIMEFYDRSICVAGTHGKTTTTSMIAQILLRGQDDPTISVGGVLDAIHSNIHVGDSDLFLAEACEYTNSFHHFYPKYNVILNVEEDHMDFFHDLDEIVESFHTFAKNTKEGGCLVIGGEIEGRERITADLNCRVITYGYDDRFDYYPTDITYDEKGAATFIPHAFGKACPPVTLHVPGRHNIGNALAAIAIARDMGLPFEEITAGLSDFGGARRRFEYKGTYNGATVIDDYAHHPTEISASLAAAENYPHTRLLVVFQPHTYTRTKAFLDDFAKALSVADLVILAKIYPAREEDIYGVSSADVAERIQKRGTECLYLETFEEIEKFLQKNLVNGDLLITMGAGNVVNVGEDLLK